MQIWNNTAHHRHAGRHEMHRGRLVPCHEVPQRLEYVLDELRRRAFAPIDAPAPDDAAVDAAIARVHEPRYLDFLRGAWAEWLALDPANAALDVLPSVWPLPNPHGFRHDVLPANFAARLGLFGFDSGTPLTAGSWQAAHQGAACALAAAHSVLAGERSAFALTRPPGHHAGPGFFGGYCFLNNAAIAAQALRDGGHARVAVLDVDYHHGNGTQTIFYERADVLTLSIHGDPRTEYPFYLGHADERGAGAGEGFNRNWALPRGTGTTAWRQALDEALQAVADHGASALVVPLGLDTFEGDPISGFSLRTTDYAGIGAAIAALRLPTVLTFEGGYAVADVGLNAAEFLEGFARAA